MQRFGAFAFHCVANGNVASTTWQTVPMEDDSLAEKRSKSQHRE